MLLYKLLRKYFGFLTETTCNTHAYLSIYNNTIIYNINLLKYIKSCENIRLNPIDILFTIKQVNKQVHFFFLNAYL